MKVHFQKRVNDCPVIVSNRPKYFSFSDTQIWSYNIKIINNYSSTLRPSSEQVSSAYGPYGTEMEKTAKFYFSHSNLAIIWKYISALSYIPKHILSHASFKFNNALLE